MMNVKSLSISAIVIGSAIALASPAQAATFSMNAQDIKNAGCIDQVFCSVKDFFTVTAEPSSGVIAAKSVGGMLGIGVTSPVDPVRGEIGVNEALQIDFKQAGVLRNLQLSFLYQPGVYGDKVFEVAQISPKGTSTVAGVLTITGDNTATWMGAGTHQSMAQSVFGQAGSYLLSDLFGDEKITGITLKALSGGSATGAGNSDFSFNSATVDVPEPATLLGLSAVGLLAAARRRQSAKA
jgi:hypothetical protein